MSKPGSDTAALSDAAPTEIDFAAFKVVTRQARRLITLGVKKGRQWDDATTVGDVARASRMAPERVVRLVRGCGYYDRLSYGGTAHVCSAR